MGNYEGDPFRNGRRPFISGAGRLHCDAFVSTRLDLCYPTFLDRLLHLFYCSCKFHCFCDGNKRIAITLTAMFLLKNGYMAVANIYFREMENISYHVAAGHIDEDLLRRILAAILTCTYDSDEELKLDIFNAISVEDVFY